MSQEIHINLSDELKKRFHATCIMQGKKMNHVVIELIQQWLENNDFYANDEGKEL
ncbi:MAG: plasmid partition protein ParG [Nostocaceae cyanobacterium]|nr:plasmid partition protein ParG [Nostocaceae cyanobacterium]